MRKFLAVLVLAAVFAACNENAEQKLENELDTLGENIKEGWDSTKAEAKELKDTLEQKWENRKDTSRKDTVKHK
jgi:galactokinase/mevalonate kinase-like predicted kinase